MMIVSGIYVIRNKRNGKIYIGSSKNIHGRVNSHYSTLKRGTHRNRHLQFAWDKYGEKAFEYKILEQCSENELLKREQHWIDTLNVTDQSIGYNISKSATASMLGLKLSDEAKGKISKANKGKKRSAEFSQRMSLIHRGHVPTDEARKNMSIANKKRGLDHIKVMVEINKERLKKDFIATSPDGIEYHVHGMKEFCEQHGLSRSMMSHVALGKRKSHHGWKCRKVE